MKLLIGKRIKFNLRNNLAVADYVKASDKVKREELFEILQNKSIPSMLLKSIIDIYSGNEIK
jgi:hypothetical protein